MQNLSHCSVETSDWVGLEEHETRMGPVTSFKISLIHFILRVFRLYVFVCMVVLGACGGRKRVSEPMKLEFQSF